MNLRIVAAGEARQPRHALQVGLIDLPGVVGIAFDLQRATVRVWRLMPRRKRRAGDGLVKEKGRGGEWKRAEGSEKGREI